MTDRDQVGHVAELTSNARQFYQKHKYFPEVNFGHLSRVCLFSKNFHNKTCKISEAQKHSVEKWLNCWDELLNTCLCIVIKRENNKNNRVSHNNSKTTRDNTLLIH